MQTIQKANLILETLEKNKYQAYLVGGCVRDLLLSKNHSITILQPMQDLMMLRNSLRKQFLQVKNLVLLQ